MEMEMNIHSKLNDTGVSLSEQKSHVRLKSSDRFHWHILKKKKQNAFIWRNKVSNTCNVFVGN